MPSNHLMLDVLPKVIRSLATVTLAAACADRLSNHCLYGLDASSRMYSSTLIVIRYGNTCVTFDMEAILMQWDP
jgi:hypothetical protein